MTAAQVDRGRLKGQAGFTLIEMIVVIAVMGLIAFVVVVKQPWRSTELELESTQRALVSALQLARARAIAQGRVVAVVTAPQGFSLDGAAPWRLPPEQVLTSAQVVFLPDGGSSGGSVVLAAPGTRVRMDVNWLTGRVLSSRLGTQ